MDLSRLLGLASGAAEAAMSTLERGSGPFRQGAALDEVGHRPWPLPDRPWFMGQTWSDLLFAHWPVDPEVLATVVPPQLPIDSFDGSAWVSVSPFWVSGLRLRGTPPAPPVSRFPELNVRTYVTIGGRPGIFFLSLDAARRAAVIAARRVYRLPYFHARMRRTARGDDVEFRSERTSEDGPDAAFGARYLPLGEAKTASPGSLEYFLTERYCLYTLDEHQHVLRGEIHHPPWRLRAAHAALPVNTMADPYGIDLVGEPTLHFSHRQDVALWRLEVVAACNATPVN
jgi:uncharacterized protein